MRRIPLASVDRSRMKWSRKTIDDTLRQLWTSRSGAVPMKLTVENLRLISACRRRHDLKGWSVRVQTQLKTNTVAVWIKQKYRGARPGRMNGNHR